MTTVTRPIHFAIKGRRKRAVLAPSPAGNGSGTTRRPPGEEATDAADGRVPRISRLMALAIRFDGLLQDGVVANQSELARLAHVTQPRMTQIMNLLNLAPDIQEEILFLPKIAKGRDPVTERDLRPIVAESAWALQRQQWQRLLRGR